MSYEIDFIGVSAEKCKQDADAICLRWRYTDSYGNTGYKVGVVDGGFDAHGEAMTQHLNRYYFEDSIDAKAIADKVVDFMVVTHADQDHTIGLKRILENFTVKIIYMNRPWLYIDELFLKVNDGRITKESLRKRLREKYKTIVEIEEIATSKGIKIHEAFQGQVIENSLRVLSPSRDFYLELLAESDKTPIMENLQYSQPVKNFEPETWTDELLREDVETSSENEMSVVIRGIIDGSGFILTGDAGIRALTKSMDYMDMIGENILSEVSFYQIPHHGGRHNLSPSVLDRMIGKIVKAGVTKSCSAIASVAENSDHPLKMVTNAYIRRGVLTYMTSGKTVRYHEGDMPDRGWSETRKIEMSDYVEKWE